MTGMRLLIATSCSRGQARKGGGGIALYIKDETECEELPLKNGRGQAESLRES